MQYTPDEARRAAKGEVIVSSTPIMERLEAELDGGVYAAYPDKQAAVRRLVDSWKDESDFELIIYMKSKRRIADQMGVKDVYDRVGDAAFWVRALGYCPLFASESYADLLREPQRVLKKAA